MVFQVPEEEDTSESFSEPVVIEAPRPPHLGLLSLPPGLSMAGIGKYVLKSWKFLHLPNSQEI